METPPTLSLSWPRHIVLTLGGCLFLTMGIELLTAAYTLNDPFSFILTFFASSFMILVSIVPIAGMILRLVALCRRRPS